MKISNAVRGGRVQVKHKCFGHSGEELRVGSVATIDRIDERDDTLRIVADHIDGGWCWVDVQYVRKYREQAVDGALEVGDSVLVGAEGAGWAHVLKDYAGKVCEVTAVMLGGAGVYITHPDVCGGNAYRSHIEHLTKCSPIAKELSIDDVKLGDYLVYSGEVSNYSELVKGVAYPVVGFNEGNSLIIQNLTSKSSSWQEGYHISINKFNKILRG